MSDTPRTDAFLQRDHVAWDELERENQNRAQPKDGHSLALADKIVTAIEGHFRDWLMHGEHTEATQLVAAIIHRELDGLTVKAAGHGSEAYYEIGLVGGTVLRIRAGRGPDCAYDHLLAALAASKTYDDEKEEWKGEWMRYAKLLTPTN